MWALPAAAMAIACALPAAVGATSQRTAGSAAPLCTSTGITFLRDAGTVSFSSKGEDASTGKIMICYATLHGTWAKNSTTYSFHATSRATLSATGTFTLASTTNLRPFKGTVKGRLNGSGLPQGTALTVDVSCWLTYRYLFMHCQIAISRASSLAAKSDGALAVTPHPAPQTAASTRLCAAAGTTPMGDSGVLALAPKGTGAAGSSVSCTLSLKGKWGVNSPLSFDATGGATLGPGGAFTLDPLANLSPLTGKMTGTLTGTGLPIGSALALEVKCRLSYAPLKAHCQIIISSV